VVVLLLTGGIMEVLYRGDLLAPSGYSRSIRAHIRGLIEAGVGVCGEHSPHDKTVLDFSKDPFWGIHMPKVMQRKSTTIKICHETPEFYNPDPTKYNIGHVLWETSHIIDYDIGGNPRFNWVKQMNSMDEIWTSSEFCLRVYKDSGVTVPIKVFPIPIDLERYAPGGSRPSFVAGSKDLTKSMVFLSVFQFTKRKNPQDLLVAWTAEFAGQEDVALVVKTYGADFKDNSKLRDFIHGLRVSCRMPNLVPNVHLILDLIPDEDMPELYRMCDVFVLPSHGEGFGMPYQEAMACGKPVIYTDASSMPEFCVGWPIACDPEPVCGMLNIPWYSASQDWWRVRVPNLRHALREAYQNWKERDHANSTFSHYQAFARKKIEELHSYAVVGAGMRARLEEIDGLIRSGSIRPDLAVWGAIPKVR
jgi:glycosyltransferase involved in cell wall biosynthesis